MNCCPFNTLLHEKYYRRSRTIAAIEKLTLKVASEISRKLETGNLF